MAGALFCPIYQIFPVWFNCTMFRCLCCFRLTTVLENCHSDALHNISRHKLATVFWNSMCEISFMTRFKQQRCRCLLPGGSLGYWRACNNFKRHCTLPYCDWGWDERTVIPKMKFSNAISEMHEFRLRVLRSLFLRFESTILEHSFRKLSEPTISVFYLRYV